LGNPVSMIWRKNVYNLILGWRGVGANVRFRSICFLILLQIALLVLMTHTPLSILGYALLPSTVILESRADFESMANDLNKRGLKAHAPAAIVGRSGVKHEFAFALIPDAGKAQVVVDTELSVKEVDEMKVLKFYVKVYDVNPKKAILCVTPKLGARASTLAKEYGITVLEDDVPRNLISMAEKVVNETLGAASK